MTIQTDEEKGLLKQSDSPQLHDLSISPEYLMLDVSKDKDFMAVLTKEWTLSVYTLQDTDDGIKYIGDPVDYKVGEVDSAKNYYMYLSVASKTGDVVISFAELEEGNIPLFTTKTPQPICRNCKIYSKKKYRDEPKELPFQGRAVYVQDKLVLVGTKTLDVHCANTLRLEYFLDLENLKQGYEALLGGETFVRHTTWAKYIPTTPQAEDGGMNSNATINHTEKTNIMTNDGDKLILMTRHIQANMLVTSYRGNLARVWSILDGSLLISFVTKNTEYVMTISDDQRFVATYEDIEKKVNVYCTKSNLLLYTYVPQEKHVDRSNFSVTYVRFYSSQPYIVIAGVITKEPEAETTNQNTPKAFYEVWSISQERLIHSMEEPGIYNNVIQPFAIERLSENDKEERVNSQSISTKQGSKCNINGSGSSGSQIASASSSASGSNDAQTTPEGDSFGSSNPQPLSENDFSGSSSLPSNIGSTNGSTTPQSNPKSNSGDYESNKSGLKSATKDATDAKKKNLPLYGVFTKQNSFAQLFFGKTLILKYYKPIENKAPTLENQVKWGNFAFQKLGGAVYLQKPLSDICEPLDGENTLGYISDHKSGVYLLRFGTHMVQLWKLAKVPEEEEVNAEAAGHIFNFQNVSRSSEGKYFNTIQHSHLEFTRAYKGYHNDDLSSFRDVWKSYGSNIHFMSDEGHIIVDIKKFPKSAKSTTGGSQPPNKPLERNPTWINQIDNAIRSLVSRPAEKQKTIISEDELFLPLSRITCSGTKYEFCEIESLFQTLHHVDSISYLPKDKSDHKEYSEDVFETKKDVLRKKVSDIIDKVLKSENGRRYFSTFSGSRTLILLASTENGRKLLFKIVRNKEIPVNVFSFMKLGKLKESVLTVLMEKADYDLFNLMFNQILIDYYKEGRGNLSAIMDALLFLQEQNFTSQLLISTKKLSFLQVNPNSVKLLNSELEGMLSIKGLQQEDTHRIEYLDTFSGMEQIERYNYCKWYMPFSYILYHFTLIKRSGFMSLLSLLLKTLYYTLFGNSRIKSDLSRLCIVPLPYFNSYRSLPEEKIKIEEKTKKRRKSTETKTFNSIQYYKYSPFALLASSVHENSIFKQGDTVMEMLVSYKWETFAKSRFYLILFCHSVYYVSYSTGVSFPEELFGYVPGTRLTNPSHRAAIVFMFISGTILLIQEFRQFLLNKLDYFKSFYNYIDLAAFILPVTTFALLCTRSPDSTVLYSVSSVTTLILWVHMILRLRVLRSFGTLLEIIIQLVGNISFVIIILIVVVTAFTNAMVVLLRRQDNGFFQDQFGLPGSDAVILNDQSQQNNFKDIFLSATTVWLFIFGYFDPAFNGEVGNYTMSIILIALFSLIVVVILFNVVIALMSGKIDKIIDKGNKIWISHFAAVVSEIELLWVFDSTKFSKKNNPTHIYYNANVETIRSHHASIVEENKKLKKKIKRELKSL